MEDKMKRDIVTERFRALPESIQELYHTDCIVHAAVWRYLHNEYTIVEMFTAIVSAMAGTVRHYKNAAIRLSETSTYVGGADLWDPPKPDAITVEMIDALLKRLAIPAPLLTSPETSVYGLGIDKWNRYSTKDVYCSPFPTITTEESK